MPVDAINKIKAVDFVFEQCFEKSLMSQKINKDILFILFC